MRGNITVKGASGGLELFLDGTSVATLQEPADPGADAWGVSTAEGAWWAVRFDVPRSASELVESGGWEAIGLPEITAWGTDVVAGDDVLRHAEIGVSSKTLAPVSMSMSTDRGEVVVRSDTEWAGWTIELAGRPAGKIAVDKEVEMTLEDDLDLPTVLLVVANAIAMAGNRTRPWILTAKRMERKTRESLLKKHGTAVEEATASGHDVRYLSTWQDSSVFGWFECIDCGRTASTFEKVGGEIRGSMGFGTTHGRLRGDLLTGTCPGRRPVG